MKKFIPIAVLVLLAACQSPPPSSPAADVSPEAVADEARARLAGDPLTYSAALSVTVSDGVATLYGPVNSEVLHQRALQLLKGTPGVFAVEDRTFRQ